MTLHALYTYVFETYTHKHIKENIQDVQSGSSTGQPQLHTEMNKDFFYTAMLAVRASSLTAPGRRACYV